MRFMAVRAMRKSHEDAPSMEVFKAWLDGALGNVIE